MKTTTAFFIKIETKYESFTFVFYSFFHFLVFKVFYYFLLAATLITAKHKPFTDEFTDQHCNLFLKFTNFCKPFIFFRKITISF